MRPKAKRIFQRFSVIFGAFIAIFTMSSCTKAFTSNLDKANQMYAAYGNIYQYEKQSTDVIDTDTDDNSIQKDMVDKQNENRKNLYNTLTGISSTSYSYTFPSDKFLKYMNDKVDEFVNKYYVVFLDSTLDKYENTVDKNGVVVQTAEAKAKTITKHVAIYAGFDYKDDIESVNNVTGVSSTFKNLDKWYDQAIVDLGQIAVPSVNFISTLKSSLSSASVSTTITPESKTFNFNGTPMYVEGKTWGQAFKEYGFLEGLFVYPFSYIIHSIISIGGNGWIQIFAIFVVTILARLITVIQTVFQARTQAKQQKLQPEMAALAKKYPNAQTDMEEKRAMSMEQMQLMKKHKVHPFLPFLFIIIQFPLFICVWSALQGSAALANGNWLGISLTTTVNQCFTNYKNVPGAMVGIFVFIFMTIANILSSTTNLWFTSWRNKKFGNQQMQAPGSPDSNKTMKFITYGMLVFVVIMGFNLPVGMGIYWFLGALIQIIQTIIMECVQTHNRHKLAKSTGDGTELAFIRRSKHHKDSKPGDNSKKSDKPLWRK